MPTGAGNKTGGKRTTVLLLGLMLVVIFGFMAWAFVASGEHGGAFFAMSGHGWVALAVALVLTAGLGGGLMWLAFYSDRKGFDEHVRPLDHDELDPRR